LLEQTILCNKPLTCYAKYTSSTLTHKQSKSVIPRTTVQHNLYKSINMYLQSTMVPARIT